MKRVFLRPLHNLELSKCVVMRIKRNRGFNGLWNGMFQVSFIFVLSKVYCCVEVFLCRFGDVSVTFWFLLVVELSWFYERIFSRWFYSINVLGYRVISEVDPLCFVEMEWMFDGWVTCSNQDFMNKVLFRVKFRSWVPWRKVIDIMGFMFIGKRVKVSVEVVGYLGLFWK